MTRKKPEVNADILLKDVLELYKDLLIPYMKVRRDLPFPTEPHRNETDGEHAFMLAIVATTIAHKMGLKLDDGKIAQYALIHDLVEAHAGDVSARSTEEEQLIKHDKEREAVMVIKKQFARKVPWIPALIEKYEAREDEEAKFVYAVDKQMGSFTWMAGGGAGWSEYYPDEDAHDFKRVVKRLRKKASAYPKLLNLFDKVHAELDKRRKDYK